VSSACSRASRSAGLGGIDLRALGRRRAGALGILEAVRLAVAHLFHQIQRGLEIRLGLAGKPTMKSPDIRMSGRAARMRSIRRR
jgi:hypothetical protein